MNGSQPQDLTVAQRAYRIRHRALTIAAAGGQGYIGQALGTADVMASLFFGEMRSTDRFVLSVGHYALSVYATLAEAGVYDMDLVTTYGEDGSEIEESPLEGLPGFEITGGSLGQGLSQAVGLAMGMALRGNPGRVFCLISDGELEEGQTWEALASASFHKVSNLVVIIDRNHQQVDGPTESVASIEPLGDRLTAFGSRAVQIDGHDLGAIRKAFEVAAEPSDKPTVIIATTQIGHKVPTIENARYLHYVRMRPEGWQTAIDSLEEVAGAGRP